MLLELQKVIYQKSEMENVSFEFGNLIFTFAINKPKVPVAGD